MKLKPGNRASPNEMQITSGIQGIAQKACKYYILYLCGEANKQNSREE